MARKILNNSNQESNKYRRNLTEWFIALNRVEAKIFKRSNKSKPFEFVQKLENPLGRERNRTLQNSRSGTEVVRIGNSAISHTMSREKNPHEEAAVQFVHRVTQFLDSERKKGSFQKLRVIADPHLTGLLRNHLSPSTAKLVIEWKHKSLKIISNEKINLLAKTPKSNMSAG